MLQQSRLSRAEKAYSKRDTIILLKEAEEKIPDAFNRVQDTLLAGELWRECDSQFKLKVVIGHSLACFLK